MDRYFSNLPMLEGWLRGRPTTDVVISSPWRETRSLDQLRRFFSEDLRRRVIGVTPSITDRSRVHLNGTRLPIYYRREAEVMLWLSVNAEPWRPWGVLDDHAWLFKPFNHRLVVCDSATGLTQRELERAAEVLDQQY